MRYWSKLQVPANSNVPYSPPAQADFGNSRGSEQDITRAYFCGVLTMGTLYTILAMIMMVSSNL